jgi:Tfp pilus assembly protein PilX
MTRSKKFQRGDIAVFMTIMISTIMMTLLLGITQKVTLESRLTRENLSSQQAIQAANTGIDAWQYALRTGDVDITNPGNNANVPNIPNEWVVLLDENNRVIEYRVEYNTSNNIPKIISTGRVTQANRTIERRLELVFN